jgi:hypothetical protein
MKFIFHFVIINILKNLKYMLFYRYFIQNMLNYRFFIQKEVI